MKLLLSFLLWIAWCAGYSQVSIADSEITPDPSAMLEVRSTTGGVLLPRLTDLQLLNLTGAAEGLMVYNTDQQKVVYYNGTEWMTLLNDTVEIEVTAGDNYQGGIVVYAAGDTGIIVSEVDNTSAAWGCVGTTVGASSTSDGVGNTATILGNGCSTSGIAADVCDDYSLTVGETTYDDWYLPAEDEMQYIADERSHLTGFSGTYWSSTESSSSQARAYHVGGSITGYWKGNSYNVRCVRKF